MTLILSIETSTKACSVALAENGVELASRWLITDQYKHAENINPLISEALADSGKEFKDLNAVAVSVGPGSYTGLRIGVSSAKGIAYALNIPVIAIRTLDLLASQLKQQLTDEKDVLFCPMLDARRMEVYTALYTSALNPIKKEEAKVIDEHSFARELSEQKIIFFADGAEKCKQVIKHPNAKFVDGVFPDAKFMIALAAAKFASKKFEDTAYFEPFYLKEFYTGNKD